MKTDAIAMFVHRYCRALEQPAAPALIVPCDVLPDEPPGFDAAVAVEVVERVERVERHVRVRVVIRGAR